MANQKVKERTSQASDDSKVQLGQLTSNPTVKRKCVETKESDGTVRRDY